MTSKHDDGELRAYAVVGRVQGVGFRWWTRRIAERLGVTGSVRNLPDGSVEVQARGSNDALVRLEAALSKGPLGARVDRLEAIEADRGMPRTDFHIRV